MSSLIKDSQPIKDFLFCLIIKYFLAQFGKNKVRRGLMIGMPMGIFIYLITFIFGISFYSNPTLNHILFDLSWQVIEQAIGGAVAGGLLSITAGVRSHKHNF